MSTSERVLRFNGRALALPERVNTKTDGNYKSHANESVFKAVQRSPVRSFFVFNLALFGGFLIVSQRLIWVEAMGNNVKYMTGMKSTPFLRLPFA